MVSTLRDCKANSDFKMLTNLRKEKLMVNDNNYKKY